MAATPAGMNEISLIEGKDTLVTFTDSAFNATIFIRVFQTDGTKFYINSLTSAIILKLKPIKTEFLSKIKVNNRFTAKIGRLRRDIETLVTDGLHKPYLYSVPWHG